ncbi:MAG TPA: tetratricopeptide repeat protein [Kofleriaceae bacterium]
MRTAPAALLVSLALARAAVAQPPAGAGARKAEAQRRFQEAESLYKRRDYLAAAAEYQAAYDLSGLAGLLYNVAQSYRLGGEKARAVSAYRRFLERAPDHQLAPLARGHVDALERELAADRGPTEEPAPPRPATGTTPRTDAAITAAPAPPAVGRARRFKVAGLMSGGIGLVALGAALHFGIEAKKASDAISNNQEGWNQSLLDRYDEGQSAETHMFVLSGVGAAALAAGGVLYYLGLRAERAEVVPITPAGVGAGAALRGRF